MVFLRVVEVFPPFNPSPTKAPDVPRWAEEVGSVAEMADLFMIASLRDPAYSNTSPVDAALLLAKRTGIETAPVIIVRDLGRSEFVGELSRGVSLGLTSVVLAWGDRPAADARAGTKDRYRGLSEAISDSLDTASEAGRSLRVLAPIDLSKTEGGAGVRLAEARMKAGASLLLAQPPTTDSEETFDLHAGVVESSGLKEKVLLSVFPFRSEDDVLQCETKFGWNLPEMLHQTARSGEKSLIEEEKKVVRRLRAEGFSGVYLSTRGNPSLAKTILS